jgi:hypothetical protein
MRALSRQPTSANGGQKWGARCLLGLLRTHGHPYCRHTATILHVITMMNAIANTHICLLNDFIARAIAFVSSAAPLSAEAIKKLEDSRDWWQHLRACHFSDLLLMTKLVALGVILEGPELVFEIIQLVKRWRKKPTKEHPPGLITVIGLIGWAIVSVGVAGEFWVDTWVNADDEKIQSINLTLLGDAHASASAAHDLAQSASEIAGPAKAKADEAETKANGARQRAQEAEVSAANVGKLEVQLRAEIEEADLVLLANSSGHTFFFHLFNSLRGAKPASVIVTCVLQSDPETLLFTQKLAAAFGDIGWLSPIPESCGREKVSNEGVLIFNKWITSEPLAARDWLLPDPHALEKDTVFGEMQLGSGVGEDGEQRLRLAHLAASLHAALQKDPGLDKDTLRIVVGRGEKPAQ